MPRINVTKVKDFPEAQFEVVVFDSTVTHHQVTVSQDYYEKLTANSASPEKLIVESFEFLLSREPNTSILNRFNLKVISNYFPDYEREMGSRLHPGDG